MRHTASRDHKPRFDAFIAGHRHRRPLPASDLASLPLFTAAATAARLIRLHLALRTDPGAGPDGLAPLRATLTRAKTDMHHAVLTARP